MHRNVPTTATAVQPARVAALRSMLRASVPAAWLQLAMLFMALIALPFAGSIDNDFWWHLRTGQLVVRHGIPTHDPFSWTKAGEPWVMHEWLSEAVIYISQSIVGYAATYVLFGLVAVSALMLMYALARQAGAGTRPLLALMLLVLVVMVSFITVRPQLFTWLMFASFLYILSRHYDGKPTRLWVLPPLMALWVNLHLGFYFGLMLIACWLAALCFDAVRGRDVPLRTPFAVALACVVATFLNPAGPAILAYPFRYLFDAQYTHAYISEWQRPQLTDPFHAPIFLSALLLALALISRTRPRPFLWLVSLAVIVLGMQAIRNEPLLELLVIPVVGATAAQRWTAARAERDSHLRVSAAVGFVLVLAIGLMLGPVALARSGGNLSLATPSTVGYPADAAAYVRSHHAGERLFNIYGEGGFLIYALYPDVPVFVDGRSDFYGDQFLFEYRRIEQAQPGWQDVLQKYDVQVILIDKARPLASALETESAWRLEFSDKDNVVYARQ